MAAEDRERYFEGVGAEILFISRNFRRKDDQKQLRAVFNGTWSSHNWVIEMFD